MEITQLVEQNPTLVRLGLHLEYSDARHRIASHLQKNIDRSKFCLHLIIFDTLKKYLLVYLSNRYILWYC